MDFWLFSIKNPVRGEKVIEISYSRSFILLGNFMSAEKFIPSIIIGSCGIVVAAVVGIVMIKRRRGGTALS